jgi:putative endonuclease
VYLRVTAENSLCGSFESLLNVRGARSEDARSSARHRHALGRFGEKIAVEHLRARGFTLLARNYRIRRGEIDLIAFNGDTLIFVQVKTRQVKTPGARLRWSPLEYLSASQLARYRWVAEAWLHDPRYASPAAQRMRFDAIGVLVDAKGAVVELRHLGGGGGGE